MNNDLISRSALLAEYSYKCGGECMICRHATDTCECKLLLEAPAVDAEPVRHGCKWCNGEYHTELSAHAVRYHTSDNFTLYALDVNYCPNCGAKMDGDNNG